MSDSSTTSSASSFRPRYRFARSEPTYRNTSTTQRPKRGISLHFDKPQDYPQTLLSPERIRYLRSLPEFRHWNHPLAGRRAMNDDIWFLQTGVASLNHLLKRGPVAFHLQTKQEQARTLANFRRNERSRTMKQQEKADTTTPDQSTDEEYPVASLQALQNAIKHYERQIYQARREIARRTYDTSPHSTSPEHGSSTWNTILRAACAPSLSTRGAIPISEPPPCIFPCLTTLTNILPDTDFMATLPEFAHWSDPQARAQDTDMVVCGRVSLPYLFLRGPMLPPWYVDADPAAEGPRDAHRILGRLPHNWAQYDSVIGEVAADIRELARHAAGLWREHGGMEGSPGSWSCGVFLPRRLPPLDETSDKDEQGVWGSQKTASVRKPTAVPAELDTVCVVFPELTSPSASTPYQPPTYAGPSTTTRAGPSRTTKAGSSTTAKARLNTTKPPAPSSAPPTTELSSPLPPAPTPPPNRTAEVISLSTTDDGATDDEADSSSYGATSESAGGVPIPSAKPATNEPFHITELERLRLDTQALEEFAQEFRAQYESARGAAGEGEGEGKGKGKEVVRDV
ncbi:hypothetical protein C7974DRAFT_413938 [Boeremia exigua]|uniref:uncharacterized protein n=1 Tax=Boeremia exigua TaxID=749465 RepID=UPI001E8D241E|nr:uncharacterized protein C7974DRAFT_413938 [Boeremia exigua]KAH6625417.1 hypothetical protein C7974DRAFT_413938 [Boeremia exigua]